MRRKIRLAKSIIQKQPRKFMNYYIFTALLILITVSFPLMHTINQIGLVRGELEQSNDIYAYNYLFSDSLSYFSSFDENLNLLQADNIDQINYIMHIQTITIRSANFTFFSYIVPDGYFSEHFSVDKPILIGLNEFEELDLIYNNFNNSQVTTGFNDYQIFSQDIYNIQVLYRPISQIDLKENNVDRGISIKKLIFSYSQAKSLFSSISMNLASRIYYSFEIQPKRHLILSKTLNEILDIESELYNTLQKLSVLAEITNDVYNRIIIKNEAVENSLSQILFIPILLIFLFYFNTMYTKELKNRLNKEMNLIYFRTGSEQFTNELYQIFFIGIPILITVLIQVLLLFLIIFFTLFSFFSLLLDLISPILILIFFFYAGYRESLTMQLNSTMERIDFPSIDSSLKILGITSIFISLVLLVGSLLKSIQASLLFIYILIQINVILITLLIIKVKQKKANKIYQINLKLLSQKSKNVLFPILFIILIISVSFTMMDLNLHATGDHLSDERVLPNVSVYGINLDQDIAESQSNIQMVEKINIYQLKADATYVEYLIELDILSYFDHFLQNDPSITLDRSNLETIVSQKQIILTSEYINKYPSALTSGLQIEMKQYSNLHSPISIPYLDELMFNKVKAFPNEILSTKASYIIAPEFDMGIIHKDADLEVLQLHSSSDAYGFPSSIDELTTLYPEAAIITTNILNDIAEENYIIHTTRLILTSIILVLLFLIHKETILLDQESRKIFEVLHTRGYSPKKREELIKENNILIYSSFTLLLAGPMILRWFIFKLISYNLFLENGINLLYPLILITLLFVPKVMNKGE
ncbi:MAG: hypothetical protein INQ03_25590 [Candidatus Heimdallarchaeota archaeon]|nr:hypothetical protein [Candidatus Heimdallarchaeota archaeon]